MKTLKQWNESGKNFSEFIKPKDEIDENLYWYFLGVLPPRIMKNYGFLVGEPYTHNNNGKPVYDSFYKSPNGNNFYYGGLKTVNEFIDPNNIKYTL